MKNDRARRRRNVSPSRAVCETKKADVWRGRKISRKKPSFSRPPLLSGRVRTCSSASGSARHGHWLITASAAAAASHRAHRASSVSSSGFSWRAGSSPDRAPSWNTIALFLSARTKRSPIRRSEARRADAAVGARDPRREPTRAFLEGRSWTTRAARRDATARVAVGSVRRAQMCGPAEEIRINHTCSARQRRTPKRCDVWIHKQRTRGGSVRSFGFKRASSGRVRPVSSFKIGAGLKLNPRVRWKRPILSPPRRLRRCCLFYSLGRRLGGRPGGAPRVVVRGRARDRRTPTLAVVATDPGASPSGVSRVVGRRAPPSIRVASASAARGSRAPGAAASFSPPRPAS